MTNETGPRAPIEPKPSHRRWTASPVVRVATVAAAVGLALVAVALFYVARVSADLPDVTELDRSGFDQATAVYTADGELLTRYFRKNRTWVGLDSIAPVVVQALIATEDRRFFEHGGIDIRRSLGAFLETLRGDPQGGSTITMQLVRNAYPEIRHDPILERKIKEWLTSRRIEQAFSKREILEVYLNTVPFLYNAYGIEAAAQTYFDRVAIELDTVQAAVLVGMLRGTSLYNPVLNPARSRQRRDLVLALMVEMGSLSATDFARLSAMETELQFNPITPEDNAAPYFAEYVRQWLEGWAQDSGFNLYTDGLRVHTTLDLRLQEAAETALTEALDRLQAVVDVSWSRPEPPIFSRDPDAYVRHRDRVEPFAHFWEANPGVLDRFVRTTSRYRAASQEGQAALDRLGSDEAFLDSVKTAATRLESGFVAMEPGTGHVRAWVGGRDFAVNKYDHAGMARRQPGSTFKPFVFAAALDHGYRPYDRLVDETVSWVDPVSGQIWEPGNFGEETGRRMPLRDALAYSKNTITAQLVLDVGPATVADYARRMGIRSDLLAVPALALGTSEVTVLEMTAAYATLVNNGRYQEPVVVTHIDDAGGRRIATFHGDRRRALSSHTAHDVLNMLRAAVDEGTGQRIRTEYGASGDFAAKTGTTQRAADGWFMLAHPDLVMGSWVGFASPLVTFRDRHWGQGSNNALRVAGRFLNEADLPEATFRAPPGYIEPVEREPAERPRQVETLLPRAVDLPRRLAADTLRTEQPADDPEPAPDAEDLAETDRLNREAREESAVSDYLDRLRSQP
jgi:penicillin-binding protein 1A